MNCSRSPNRRPCSIVVVAALTVAYAVIFLVFRTSTAGLSALIVFPVAAAAWFWGLKAGLLASAAGIMLNLLLFMAVGRNFAEELISRGGLPGVCAMALLAGVVGHLRDLRMRYRERLKELDCLYRLSTIVSGDLDLDEMMPRLVRELPPSWQNPERTEAEIRVNEKRFTTPGFVESRWMQERTFDLGRYGTGSVRVMYRGTARGDPFVPEEYRLLDAVSETVARAAEGRLVREELRASKASFHRIVEGLRRQFFFYSHDTEGVFTYLSPSITSVLGYEVDEFMTHFSDYLTDNPVNEEVEEHSRGSIEGIAQPAYEVEIYHKNGSVHWLEVSEIPVFDANGTVIAVEGIAHDITEHKRMEDALRQSEEGFRTMFEVSSEALHLVDTETNSFVEVNQAMSDLFGYPREELLHMSPANLVSPEHARGQPELMDFLLGGGKLDNLEGVVFSRGGEPHSALTSARIIRWKGKPVVFGSMRDITELKATQHRLEEKNREVLEFTNMVNHDLKKPLAALKMTLSVFGDQMRDMMDDDARESMDTAYQSIDYMQSMLEDLLACARLESGKDMLRMEEVDVGEVLNEVLSQLRSEIDRKHITVQRESIDGKGLRADRKSVTKIFMNLIGNAINYIGDGPGRTIRVERSPEGVFTVSDNGIGIPEDARDEVMEKFRRGTNALSITGTGLGLPIVKTAVEAHGGKLWFDSKEGAGTAFHFTLQPE